MIQKIFFQLSQHGSGDENTLKLSSVEDVNVDVQFILLDLKSVNSYYDDFKDYRLWLFLSQQKMNLQEDGEGDFQSALDFLENGIKEIPTNP